MLADSPKEVQSGTLDKEIHLPGEARQHLVEFIAEELPRWRDHPDRPPKDAETALTEHLCDYLTGAARDSTTWSHIQFRTETGDEGRSGRKIDLSVKPCGVAITIENRRHTQFDVIFPIECKRLPTPTATDRDEREYVITEPGTTGGIQRFKFGYHGSTHEFAAMIGYVQDQDDAHWLKTINGWIDGLAAESNSAWSAADALEMVTCDSDKRLCSLKSQHKRTEALSDIELRHLWIQMN